MQNVYTRKNRGSTSMNNGGGSSSSSFTMTTAAKTEATAVTASSSSTTPTPTTSTSTSTPTTSSSIQNPFQTNYPRQRRRRRRRKNKSSNKNTTTFVWPLIGIVSVVSLAYVFLFSRSSDNTNSSSISSINGIDDDWERTRQRHVDHAHDDADLREGEIGEQGRAARLAGTIRNSMKNRKNSDIGEIMDEMDHVNAFGESASTSAKSTSNRLLDKSKSFLQDQKQKMFELRKKMGREREENTQVEGKKKKKKKKFLMPLSSFENIPEPNLKTMTFRLPSYDENDGISEEIQFQAYVQPHVSKFYKRNDSGNHEIKMKTKTAKKPQFHGMAGKFINLSKKRLQLNWFGGGQMIYIADSAPFQAVGTSTFPGHLFTFSTKAKSPSSKTNNGHGHQGQNAASSSESEIVHKMNVVSGTSVYYYDPYYNSTTHKIDLESLHNDLNKDELEQYWLQRRNLDFGKIYYNFTGREWLSLYPKRKPPYHIMWNADYFGQEHWVVSEEAHFVREPPENLLGMLSYDEMMDESVLYQKRHLKDYRQSEGLHSKSQGHGHAHDKLFLNMTLKVLSCAPRVFEIKNFLSHVEVDHIVHMATGMKLSLSTTSGSDGYDRRSDTKTRTSKNSWVGRSRSPIIDSIYRRAADLMLIDEALLRHRDMSEQHDNGDDVRYSRGNSAEDLQLVHYAKTEKYTAHHDFAYPSAFKEHQPTRFATLLLYLNEGMKGGETSFPRWVNAETSAKLSVVPEVGKAVLFYSFLPDGNMDDLSQHAAEPVIDGEKWLINLWTWDPTR